METILVTGASGNLGKAVIERLHQVGYSLLATVANESEKDMFVKLPQVRAEVVNVLDATAVSTFLNETQTPPIRAAVLLVGGFGMGGFADTDVDFLQKMYALNFLSAFNVVKPLMAQFSERGGQIILIGARSGQNFAEGHGMVAYSLSKTLIFALAELINAAGKTDQITATVVSPSMMDTPANRTAMPYANFANWVPTENVADLIQFLLSDTGRMIRETVVKIYNQS